MRLRLADLLHSVRKDRAFRDRYRYAIISQPIVRDVSHLEIPRADQALDTQLLWKEDISGHHAWDMIVAKLERGIRTSRAPTGGYQQIRLRSNEEIQLILLIAKAFKFATRVHRGLGR